MSLWLVRAGKHGEQEQGALENNVITIGWNELPDLSGLNSRAQLLELYRKVHPNATKPQATNEVGQVWRFAHEIQRDDLVALPLKMRKAIAIGRVRGGYEYRLLTSNIKHIRLVEWLATIPRSSFDQDLLYSLGAFMTVCRIERHDAENRVKTILAGGTAVSGDDMPPAPATRVDVATYAEDEIVKHIEAKFKGHDLARLVGAILYAQGHVTRESSRGPDGGVDILAAAGTLGFDDPKICVQVKSSSSPVDFKVLRELQGVMSKVRAQQGLLVAWGGFTNSCLQEGKDAFFSIRLWDQGDLLAQIFRYYEHFDDELKAELPLKRIWALVSEE